MTAVRPPTLDRARVIETAVSLIETGGADDLTLSAIARELGVTQPALYRHVDSLADIWRALGLTIRADLTETLGDAATGVSGTDAVRSVATAWRTFGRSRPALYRVTDRYPVVDDPELEAAVERVVSVLGRSLRGFGLTDAQQVHGARALRSALHGFVTFEIGNGHPPPHNGDETFEQLIELLCVGFGALAAGPEAEENRR